MKLFLDYFRDRWNHIVFVLDKRRHKLILNLNGKEVETTLPADFSIHPHYAHYKISDDSSSIDLHVNILIFNSPIEPKHISELYYNGNTATRIY